MTDIKTTLMQPGTLPWFNLGKPQVKGSWVYQKGKICTYGVEQTLFKNRTLRNHIKLTLN